VPDLSEQILGGEVLPVRRVLRWTQLAGGSRSRSSALAAGW